MVADRSALPSLVTAVTDEVVPHFHNEPGVPVIEIGAKTFMCIGALPPQDHLRLRRSRLNFNMALWTNSDFGHREAGVLHRLYRSNYVCSAKRLPALRHSAIPEENGPLREAIACNYLRIAC